ncbi:MAG: hypothetical protein GYB66_15900 [Chloroflexi bacterium]|nr:hypothetical protein [Chloroflexota bacterium]
MYNFMQIKHNSRLFLRAQLARSGNYHARACLTLTAIHPDGRHRTPSRHIPLDRPDLLDEALARLVATNQLGWDPFVAVGLPRHGLTRYQQGTCPGAVLPNPKLAAHPTQRVVVLDHTGPGSQFVKKTQNRVDY